MKKKGKVTNKEIEKGSFVILKGEGVHEHVLNGEAAVEDIKEGIKILEVERALLQHVNPIKKSKGQHNTILLDSGVYFTGRQVEVDPLSDESRRILD